MTLDLLRLPLREIIQNQIFSGGRDDSRDYTTWLTTWLKIGTRGVHVGSLSEVRARHFKLRLYVAKHCDHVKHAAITLFHRLCSNYQCYSD